MYLIKLPQQKDANLILTRKCFTFAIKTSQLSSHTTQHDEFIKATFSGEIFFLKQTTYLLLEAKTPSYFITCVKTRNSILSNYHTQLQQNKIRDQTLSIISLNNEAKNRRQAFFQIILGCHISNYFFLPEDCAELSTKNTNSQTTEITDPLKAFDSFSVFVEPIRYQGIFQLVSVFYITAHLVRILEIQLTLISARRAIVVVEVHYSSLLRFQIFIFHRLSCLCN